MDGFLQSSEFYEKYIFLDKEKANEFFQGTMAKASNNELITIMSRDYIIRDVSIDAKNYPVSVKVEYVLAVSAK